MNLHKELNLLIELSKKNRNHKQIINDLSSIQNWENFKNAIIAHGLLPIIFKKLTQEMHQYVPIDILKELHQEYNHLLKKNMLMSIELTSLMRLLEDNNINALAIKGPTLSILAYGNVINRPYTDLDILIDKKDIFKTATILLEHQYSSSYNIKLLKEKVYLKLDNDFNFFTKQGTHIEVHWRLLRGIIGEDLPFNRYFTTKTKVRINQTSVNTLNLEDLLVYLCIHGSKHAWERLEWINDIHMLIDNNAIDWEKVLKSAEEMDAFISLYLGLHLAKTFYAIVLPSYINEELQNEKIKLLVQEVIYFLNSDLINSANYTLYKKLNWFQAQLISSKKKKLQHYISRYLKVTRNDYLFLPLPSYLIWLYYFIKPFRIAYKIIIKTD